MRNIGNIGSRNRTTYFWYDKRGIYVRCGCWAGWLEDFKKRVKETYPDKKNVYRIQYLLAIKFIEKIK